MKTRKMLVVILTVLLIVAVLAPPKVVAAERKATITAPGEISTGQTFTVTLGFSPKADTRSCNFTLQYDNELIQYVSGSASNVSGMSGEISIGDKSPLSMVLLTLSTGSADKVISLKFKVLKKGSVTIKVTAASDGEQANTVSVGASRTITLSDPAPSTTTTTTTTTTTPHTTTTTTTPTSKTTTTTTTSKTTTPTTPTSSTASTTPTTTLTEIDYHPSQALIGKRYDGVSLFVPETIPSDDLIPDSFQALDILWEGKQLTGYDSETLPYKLFWLIDEEGETRFYLYDEVLAVFIPFLRVEWSSRFYTLSLLSQEEIPQGFEVTTIRVWGEDVPGYRPLGNFFLTKAAYDAYLAGEEGGEGELPGDIYLLALRMNDAEAKGLYLYDRGIDSLIRADLWLVPLAGSILDPDQEPLPTEPTQPLASDPEPTKPLESEVPGGASTVNLFGFQVPLYLLVAGVMAVLLLVALMLWLIFRARKAADYEPELTLADLNEGEEKDLPEAVAEPLESGLDHESSEKGEAAPLDDDPASPDLGIQPEEDVDLVSDLEDEESLSEETIFQEIPLLEEAEKSWAALSQTLLEVEEKKRQEDQSRTRLPGIRPLTHRRLERDDPEDQEEL